MINIQIFCEIMVELDEIEGGGPTRLGKGRVR